MSKLLTFFVLLNSLSAFCQAQTKTILPNSKIEFEIKNLFGTVHGELSSLEGLIIFEAAQPEKSYFKVKVGVSSLDTKLKKRDEHLLAPEFFDVAHYPYIYFESTALRKVQNSFIVTGTLQIRDKIKTVEMPFTFEDNTFVGNLTINRLDFRVGESSMMMRDEVKIRITCVTKDNF